MIINIASAHRFHLLDLARELETHGHEVRFYSYVPTNRALKFGLKKECSYSVFYIMLPFLALVKISKGSSWSTKLLHRALDNYLSFFMKPCDVYIALGTVYKKSLISAKNKFGATTILEWGSKHIISQEYAITKNTNAKKQKKYFINRSLTGYQIADYIAIPSTHVKESFILNGIRTNKILVNPYGVDLKMFPPTKLDNNSVYDLIMVGNWSYTKGCDLLIEYFKNHNYSFLHVGSIKDLPFPNFKNMFHIDPVDQSELKKYYSKARAFVLSSRAEGLAMVQCQALACGLPIVCSADTGGRDLRDILDDKKWIIEMNDFSVKSLNDSISKALKLADTQKGKRDYAGSAIENLTWKAYGDRYNHQLISIVNYSHSSK